MAAKKILNGKLVDMDPAEEAAFEASRAPTLDDTRASMHQRVDAIRAKVESQGVAVKGKRTSTDRDAILRLSLLAAASKQPPADVLAAVGDLLQACAARADALHAEIDAAKTVEEALAVEVDSGWPAAGSGGGVIGQEPKGPA